MDPDLSSRRLDRFSTSTNLSDDAVGCLELLATTALFGGLRGDDLGDVALCCVEKSVRKGAYLFHEGDAAAGFFIVHRGIVGLYRVTEDGREQMVRLFSPGESFAEAVLAGMDVYPVTARAEAASAVVLVRKAELVALIQRRPRIALLLIASLSRHLHGLVVQLETLRDSSVGQRLRKWLLARCPVPLPPGPVAIALPGTKSLLAAELGTVAETLSRALASFRDEGWISVEGRMITVNDPHQLAREDI